MRPHTPHPIIHQPHPPRAGPSRPIAPMVSVPACQNLTTALCRVDTSAGPFYPLRCVCTIPAHIFPTSFLGDVGADRHHVFFGRYPGAMCRGLAPPGPPSMAVENDNRRCFYTYLYQMRGLRFKQKPCLGARRRAGIERGRAAEQRTAEG